MLQFIHKAVSSGRFLPVSETCPARHISLLLTSATNLKTTFILFYFSVRHEMRRPLLKCLPALDSQPKARVCPGELLKLQHEENESILLLFNSGLKFHL